MITAVPAVRQPEIVLVTGVSSGIGRATAQLLAQSGYRVYGTVRKIVPEAEMPGVALLALDLRNEASAEAAVQSLLEKEGRVDALVNNAGMAVTGSIEETTIEQASDLFDTNVLGLVRVTKAVLPAMRAQRSGRIVNIGSIVGIIPAPFMGLYCASKHAVEGYSESLDHEIRSFGIRVSVIEPGFTRTRLATNALTANSRIADYREIHDRVERAFNEQFNKGVEPIEVARVVLAALRAGNPRHRYPVGRASAMLSLLRRFAPAGALDRGLRQQFRLDG
jgi:NAD(P)-dependent dehydrogenase (short-subunit alcohol dehydrogenase family)